MYNEDTAYTITTLSPQAKIQDNPNCSHTFLFGNGSQSSTSKQLNITSKYSPAVLPQEQCPNNLLPEKALSDLDCTTTFIRDTCTITPPPSSKLNTIVLHRDPKTHVFHANLHEIHTMMQNIQNERDPDPDPTYHNLRAFSAVLTRHAHTTIEYQVVDLHEKMGHPPCEAMCAAVQEPNPAWKNTGLTAKQIRRVFSEYTCIPCAAAKKNLRSPADRSQEERIKWKPGECFSCDPAVKINPKGFDGNDCFFLFKDISTGYLYAVITDSKKSSAFTEAFQQVLNFFARHKCVPTQILRSDSEAIFLSSEVKEFLQTRHIESQTSAPDRHFQVSVERDMQTLFKGLSTMLNAQPFLRYDLWPLALNEYIERKNRTPNKRCFPKSPHQVITGTSTDLNRQFTFKFGDIVLAGTPDRVRDSKFDPKNEVGIYIGQEAGTTDTHRILLPHNHKIKLNGSVSKLDVNDEQLNKWIVSRTTSSVPVYREITEAFHDFLSTPPAAPATVPPAVPAAPNILLTENTSPNQTVSQSSDRHARTLLGEDIFNEFTPEEQQTILNTRFLPLLEKYAALLIQHTKQRSSGKRVLSESTDQHQHRMVTRSRPTNFSSLLCLDNNVHLHSPPDATHYVAMSAIYGNTVNNIKKVPDTDTPTVRQAMLMPDREEWKKAIKAEINALLKDTLKSVNIKTFPKDSYIKIATTTQLKRKRNAITCAIEKYKARECARGDLLAFLMCSEETYSPTISPITFALILQIAVIFKMKRKTVDTVGAYLYQSYPTDKRTLITQLNPVVADICGLDPDAHYQIVRYLYGLPDAGKAYYEAYSAHLVNNGYKKSAFDPCLFFKIDDQEMTFVVIHVDDTFIFSTTDAAINKFTNMLQTKFDITVNDDADAYLGVSFVTDPSTGNVKLHQPKLIQSLLEQYSTQMKTPPSSITTKEYQQLLGTLMYLTKSRPDIQTSISFAATHSITPTLEHYIDLLKIVTYIERTQDYGLIIHAYDYNITESLQLICHVDASYLTHEDSKSHTGYTLSFGTIGTFYSKSSKQSLVSTSSTHAEARALYTLLQEIIYVISICQELGIALKLPVLVYEDNYPVVQLTNNLAPKAKKCKHFLMLLNYIKEQIEAGIIDVRHIDTNNNLADILTKILTGFPFHSKADKLLGNQSHINNEEITKKAKKGQIENR